MPSYKKTPLLMYPDGTFARSNAIVKGCVVVKEAHDTVEIGEIINQTEAVKKAESNE